jgi:hypothetical protein
MPAKKRQPAKKAAVQSSSKRSSSSNFHPLKSSTWPGGRIGAFAFIVFIALCGGVFVAFSHAAGAQEEGVTVGSTPGGVHLCVDDGQAGGTASMYPCNANNSDQLWQINGGKIVGDSAGVSYCLQPRGSGKSAVIEEPCGSSSLQKWANPSGTAWKGYLSGALYNVGSWNNGKGQKNCLVDPGGANELTSGGSLETVGCGTQADLNANRAYEDQIFSNYYYTVGGKPTPKPTPKPTAKPTPVISTCILHDYSSGSSGSCVSAIQSILNYAYIYYHNDHGGTIPYNGKEISVDGSFGSLTEAQVKVFQNYFNGSNSVDGVVGPETWGTLCYVAYYHDVSADYRNAGCTSHNL